MTSLDISNGFYQAEALQSMNSVCQNMYPKSVSLPNGEVRWRLLRTPGVGEVLRADSGGALTSDFNRGLHEIGPNAYAVNGNTLYFIDVDAVFPGATALGTIAGTGQVSMADNGTQLMILVPGVAGYIYNQDTSTFTQITDPDFTANGSPQYCIFIDGYFMVSTDGQRFIISALRDGTNWNALDFGSAEADPDPISGLFNYKNEAYIFGTGTCEAFQNIGGAGFPFQRNGLILNKGLTSPLSIVETTNTFMWIGAGFEEQSAIYALAGAQAVKVSNTAVDLLLRRLTVAEQLEIRGFAYMQDGSYFVCWVLPNVTVVYDIIEQRWHTRTSNYEFGNTRITSAWRCINVIERPNGELISGDTISNRIGIITSATNTEYQVNPIYHMWDALPIESENVLAFPQLELRVDGENANGADIEMAISRDAYTFGGWRARRVEGSQNRRKRAKWRRNGRFTDYAQFRFRTTAPIAAVLGVNVPIRTGRG